MRALATALALVLAAPAVAQLDLPDKGGKDTTPPGLKRGTAGDVAPHLTCTVCYEANYTARIDWEAKDGYQNTYCKVCQAPRLHQVPKQGAGKNGRGIDLPAGERDAPPAPVAEAPPATPIVLDQDPAQDQLTRAAEEILTVLDRVKSVEDPIALQAGETLLSLGGPGRVAARLALADDHAPKMLTGVRVLLRTGVAEDAEIVVSRLRRRMPARAAAVAVGELILQDPVRATPSFLCELLDHEQQPVRKAAGRQLATMDLDDVLPYLVPCFESQRSDTRLRAIELVSVGDHPLQRDLLLTRIADPRAKVARRVVEALTSLEDPDVDTVLLAGAFGERWILRPAAFHLLALMEREDAQLAAHLTEGHIQTLLRGLASNDPFVSGTCAAALAGIGFRSESEAVSEWLDDAVPARLVAVVSGYEFFDDYEALRETALRRLKMVTGTSFGTDGPAWAEWWLEARESFVASRAVVPIAEGDERRLSVSLVDRGTGEAFLLVGPDLAEGAPADRGEVFYLDAGTASELLDFLDSQRVFGLERLPGSRGGMIDSGRVVDVRLGDRGKTFVIGAGGSAPWFDQVVGRTQALAERSHWQRYPHPETHGSRLALFRSEGAWWGGDHDAAARSARLKALVLERAKALPVAERDPEVLALQRLYGDPANAAESDFPTLLALLAQEPWLGGRAVDLARLARVAAGLVDAPLAADGPEARRVWLLVDALHERFTAEAMPELADLLTAAGSDFARIASTDPRPILRAVSTHALALSPGEAERASLAALLEDEVLNVEVAAVEAVGHARLQELRGEVLLRARLGKADVRIAALQAIGRLGGQDVRDTLVTSLTDSDGRFRLAAARGLAELQDPSTASLLVSLLRQRGTAGMAPIVRAALLDMGEPAHDELFLAMRSPSRDLQREASLLLGRQGVPQAAPVMMELLASDPVDAELARELAILTSVDLREEIDPPEAWFRWLDTVRRGDSLAWLRAAAEARGIAAPEGEAFDTPGDRDVIGFLVQLMRLEEEFLAERARRVLASFLDRDVDPLPPHGAARDAWLVALLEVLEDQR